MSEKVSVIVELKDLASKGTKGIGNAFKDAGKKVLSFLSPANLVIAGFAALSAGIIKTMQVMTSLETKMTNVGNLFGASKEQVNDLTADVIKLGQEVPQSFENLSEALFDVVSAGVPAAESIEFLGAASKLATAGVTDTKTAVDGLTSVMNAFGYSASDATMISDKFFAAQQKGKTTIAELSNSIGQVAPLAAGMGVSFDELVSAMSTLTLSGIRTTEAATGLKAAFSNLIKPSEKAKEVSQLLGIEFDANAVKQKGLVNVLKDVIEKTGGSKDALGRLFGSVEAVNSVIALSRNEFKSFNDVQKEVQNSSGRTEEAFKKNMDTIASKLKVLGNKLIAFGAVFINKVTPAINLTIDALTKMVDIGTKIFKTLTGVYKEEAEKQLEITGEMTSEMLTTFHDTEEEKVKIKKDAEEEKRKEIEKSKQKEIDALIKTLDEKKSTNKAGLKSDSDTLAAQRIEWENFTNDYDKFQARMKGSDLDRHNEQIKYLEEYEKQNELSVQNREKLNAKIMQASRARDEYVLQSVKDAADGEKDILKGTTNFVKEQLKKQVKAYIEEKQMELAATVAANWWNPIGWVSAAYLVALEVLKNEASARIDQFEQGGIVGGNSFFGDKKTVKVNSGEMILNNQQQRNLSDRLFLEANRKSSSSSSDDALIEEIRLLRAELNAPKMIKLNGDSFAKATYETQKSLLRTGQISSKD